jgi:hypothetical protein
MQYYSRAPAACKSAGDPSSCSIQSVYTERAEQNTRFLVGNNKIIVRSFFFQF